MSNPLVDEIANAVLYEGYMLYPYRASAVKNRQRWNFGVLSPAGYGESIMQTEALVMPGSDARLSVRVRFLHLVERSENGQSWQEAMEREVSMQPAGLEERRQDFSFPGGVGEDGNVQRRQECVEGLLEMQLSEAAAGAFKISIRIRNTASCEPNVFGRDEALLRSMVSTHTILHVENGELVSLLEPPEGLREIAASCRNVGTWPVLAGAEGQRDTMLSSPIILYDHPQIAPESPGALFDGTEIDEILTLRILTLTDEEKLEMSRGDERARQILERTESMPAEQLMKLHGTLRGLKTS